MNDGLQLELYTLPCLPPRRELVIPVAVLRLNLPVPAVDQQFSALVFGNFPRPVNGMRFTVEKLRRALCPSALNSPAIFAGDHVLIAFCHVDHLFRSGIAAHLYVRQRFEMQT